MGWTEHEYQNQRWDFINEVATFITERNKKINEQQQGTANHIKSR
jgi:hypothetical protein